MRRHPGRDLTAGSISRHLLLFSLPLLLGSLLQSAYSVINAIWVGNYLEPEALAAVTVSFPVVFLLIAVGGGLTLATNILISQYAGARDWGRVRAVVQSSILLVSGLSVLLLALGLVSAESLLRLMKTPASVLPLAAGYLRIYLLTLPMSFGIFLLSSMLRGLGDSRTPLYFQAVSVVLAAVLDPVLMLGWLGAPRLGLNGTAVASVISLLAALVALIVHLQARRHLIAQDWGRLRLDGPTGWLLARIGVPSIIQQSLWSVGMLMLTGMVNTFGSQVTAAFGAALRIDQVAFLPAMSIGMAVATLAGQNLGAGSLMRVRQTFWWGLLWSVVLTAPLSALAILYPEPLLRIFTGDAQVLAYGARYLQIVGFNYVPFAVLFVSNGVINGAGQTGTTTVITLLGLWAIRLPLAAALSQMPLRHGALVWAGRWGEIRVPVPAWLRGIVHQVEGIWLAMTLSVLVSMVISLLYYASGRWRCGLLQQDGRARCLDNPEESP